MRTVFLLVAIATGCCPESDDYKVPNQDEAVAIIWREMYGMTDAPPRIVWVRERECTWGAGRDYPDGWPGFYTTTGDCGTGEYFPWCDCAKVMERGPIYLSTIPHELMHAKHKRLGLDDPNHNVYWEDWVFESQVVRRRLKEAGL